MVFAGQQDPIKGHFELAFDPKDITNDHHGIIQVNATDRKLFLPDRSRLERTEY